MDGGQDGFFSGGIWEGPAWQRNVFLVSPAGSGSVGCVGHLPFQPSPLVLVEGAWLTRGVQGVKELVMARHRLFSLQTVA